MKPIDCPVVSVILIKVHVFHGLVMTQLLKVAHEGG